MKNLLTAVVLSAAVLLGFEFYMVKYGPAPEVAVEAEDNVALAGEVADLGLVGAAENEADAAVAAGGGADELVPFVVAGVSGDVALRGGLPRTVALREFLPHGDEVVLAEGGIELVGMGDFQQRLEAGYVAGGLDVPNKDTVWTLQTAGAMTADNRMVLTYKNATGQSFSRELWFEGYVLRVEDTVVNGASVPVSVQYRAAVVRKGEHKSGELSSWYNYFGPQGMVTGEVANHSYKNVLKRTRATTGSGGYWGFSEQFFAVMGLPRAAVSSERQFRAAGDMFVAEVTKPVQFVPAGSGQTFDYAFYVGPKKISALAAAGNRLDTVVDFGWFHFIAKPMYVALKYFHGWFGNWGWAIVALTVVLKLLTYPLAAKSYKSMGKMRKIQPEVKALQEKHKDGARDVMATEMMALYKKHGVNPMSGCWPMFVQIPIFFAMYKMVLLTFELRGAEFVLWVNDLSVADPYFVLPVLMGVSMWVQMKLSPTMGDPVQAKVMQFLPIVFTVLFLFFPSGLVLYWLTNNVISVAQQWWFLRAAEKA